METLFRVLTNPVCSQSNTAVEFRDVRFQFRVKNDRSLVTSIVEGSIGRDFVLNRSNVVTLADNNVSFQIDLVLLIRSLLLVGIENVCPHDDSISRQANRSKIHSVVEWRSLNHNGDTTRNSCDLFCGRRVSR